MSTTETTRPADPHATFDRPTATFPTGQWLAEQAAVEQAEWARRERLADIWADATPTEELPAVPAGRAFPRVSTSAKPTGSRVARHLRAALAGILIAAALLTGLQLYAAAGISAARQAALEQARTPAAGAAPLSGQSNFTPTSPMSGQSDPKPDWVTEHTGAAYDRTNPAASPLGLPRCTTSPDTPLPCLATISPDSRRAVVLEEDASLTALVRR